MKVLVSKHIKLAKNLRRNSTEAERALWRHLRNKQVDGEKFRRQQPIGNYIVDFVCLARKVIVEIDGGQHAAEEMRDQEREQWLTREGFKVLRF